MHRGPDGHRDDVADDEAPEERRSDKPMYGERRPLTPALLGVVGMVVVVVLVFLLFTYIS